MNDSHYVARDVITTVGQILVLERFCTSAFCYAPVVRNNGSENCSVSSRQEEVSNIDDDGCIVIMSESQAALPTLYISQRLLFFAAEWSEAKIVRNCLITTHNRAINL